MYKLLIQLEKDKYFTVNRAANSNSFAELYIYIYIYTRRHLKDLQSDERNNRVF